jgi:four helix bundle protein
VSEVKRFTDLTSWKEAHNLALEIYKETKKFPKEEQYGLTSQMRRCSVSVPSNIAEGFNRYGKGEKLQHYNVSLASSGELQSQLYLARDLEFIGVVKIREIDNRIEKVRALVLGLIKSTRAK